MNYATRLRLVTQDHPHENSHYYPLFFILCTSLYITITVIGIFTDSFGVLKLMDASVDLLVHD
jgi:hypothetical protein